MKRKKQELPSIQVVSITENSDGSANIVCDVSDSFIEYMTKETGIENPSMPDLSKFIIELIEKACDRVDGFDLQSSQAPESKTKKQTITTKKLKSNTKVKKTKNQEEEE